MIQRLIASEWVLTFIYFNFQIIRVKGGCNATDLQGVLCQDQQLLIETVSGGFWRSERCYVTILEVFTTAITAIIISTILRFALSWNASCFWEQKLCQYLVWGI